MPTFHVHADESGSLKFSDRSLDHFVFAAAWTYEPAQVARELREFRYELLRDGKDLERFHARKDNPWRRYEVIDRIANDASWHFAAVVVQMGKVYGELQDKRKFYGQFMPYVLKFPLRGRVRADTDRVVIYTDQLPMNKQRKGVKKAIHRSCAAELDDDITFHMYHHCSESNAWLQVADYCAWSVMRKYEHDDSSYYDRLRPRLAAPELVLWEN